MKRIRKTISIIGLAFSIVFTSCGTLTTDHIGECQKTKPKKGEPKRELNTGKLVGDIVLGLFTFGIGIPVFIGIDLHTGAIWKPCGESLKIDEKTGEKKSKGFSK